VEPLTEPAVRLIPLGGLGEIGLNMMLVEFGDDVIAVDCGLMFPDPDEMPGIDYVIPDFSYALAKREGFRAVFLTHGHEDHIGAVPYLLREIRLPVYGTPMTLALVAEKLREHGRSVLVGAADTFRAAAEEQLEIWAERAGADFVGSPRGADPAAVAFDAVEAARARGHDVAIIDTAGRLHTQTNLMAELEKVRRVVASKLDGAPHETLLIVDATTGQNGLQQARLFGDAVQVTGVALTKLDGSARGGVAIAIAVELGLPVKLVGVGEGVDDLRPFDAHDYARALVAK